MPGPEETTAPPKILWLARLERRFHTWRERRARARGLTPTVTPFPGYGGDGWIRVLGRVLIVPPRKPRGGGEYASVRGWRSFLAVPVGFARVEVTVAGTTHTVTADRGGVVDVVLDASLPTGWQTFTMTVEGSEPVESRVFVVAPDARFGIVSDVDDTVMVTALPRPLLAAWNSFVVDEHARQPVPGMAVLLERLAREHPGSPVVYLSTGAWNVAPTLVRFIRPARSCLRTGARPTTGGFAVVAPTKSAVCSVLQRSSRTSAGCSSATTANTMTRSTRRLQATIRGTWQRSRSAASPPPRRCSREVVPP